MNISYDPQDYFSSGFHNFMVQIAPHRGKKEAFYPKPVENTTIKWGDQSQGYETMIRGWFDRIVETDLEGDPGACQVETKMGAFAHLIYSESRLKKANISVIIATGADNLAAFLHDGGRVVYLRLDYDPASLGKMFSHPHPHLHLFPAVPRFYCGPPSGGNIILDFFDFIYRNFFYEERWAVWMKHAIKKGRPEMRKIRLQQIEEAFKDGKHDLLATTYKNELELIKEACSVQKRKMCPLPMNWETCSILSY